MKKQRKRPSAFPALAWRIIALALALWLLAMGLLTWAVAQDMYYQLRAVTQEYAEIMSSAYLPTENEDNNLPGYAEYNIIRDMDLAYSVPSLRLEPLLPFVLPQFPSSYSTDDWFWSSRDLLQGYHAAVLYEDTCRDITLESSSYFYLYYIAADAWAAQDTSYTGCAYVDLSHLTGDLNGIGYNTCIRMTGYFEGNEFFPTLIDMGYSSDSSGDDDLPRFNHLDLANKLIWENVYAAGQTVDQELVTIYGWGWHFWDATFFHYDAGDPLTVNGIQYHDLVELLECYHNDGNASKFERENLFDSIIVTKASTRNEDGWYTAVLAVRCWPLQYALLRLIPTYLVTFFVTALLVFLLLRRIRKNLTQPLEDALAHTTPRSSAEKAWQEPSALWKGFYQARLDLRESQNQVQQLRSALDYAEHAEENRQRLVSNLTHDLKTPLAIIHGYAEGLQAGIAGEKQDQYLSTILEESERMDAMVLEMLDLSRLEAGKVRLAADVFSLPALAKSVVQKLSLQAEAKHLEIRYGLIESCMVTADEARITQVITNLVTNAIKYSPDGGEIRINVFHHQKHVHFTIENTCQPLPEEVLGKIWTSFYRGDVSRTEEGHGLGLAIVKSIIDLHQGTCSAENTKTGVLFRFSLPL